MPRRKSTPFSMLLPGQGHVLGVETDEATPVKCRLGVLRQEAATIMSSCFLLLLRCNGSQQQQPLTVVNVIKSRVATPGRTLPPEKFASFKKKKIKIIID